MADSPTKNMFVEDDETETKAKKPQSKKSKVDATPSDVEMLDSMSSEKQEDKVIAGANILDLPSKGLLGYPETVEYRDILVRDEETLATATTDTYTRTLNGVLKGIINSPSFFEKMTIFDRDFLLVWIWANNYTADKKVNVTCGNCSTTTEHNVNLHEIDVSDVSDRIKVPFKLDLHGGEGKFVNLRLNTVADEIEVEKFLAQGDNRKTHTYEHLMMVASIDVGISLMFAKKVEWVRDNMKARDMAYVKKFHQYFKYGINASVDYKCPSCGEVTVGELPFQAEDVLFPTVPDDFEELL
ncbi:MAG: hypothetical protein CMF22_11310 [Idiomarinaceae bacterium]|nr:hypothetical protein [Idiomarinaceae bacterium]|tara:strand:- start:123109 stop:124002 length:894 start_codon:yes stop_codon:yes gene_type:complete